MQITTKITWNMLTGEVTEHEFYEYPDNAPLALCDRNLQSSAKKQAGQAGADASQYGSSATTDSSAVTPFLNQEMKATHGYDPTQINELLTAAEAGSGGATSALTGQAGLEAARTHNGAGFTKALDEAARDKSKANAGASEGIAAMDVNKAKELNQAGAAGLEGLYGTNVDAQMKAMGLQNQDTQTALQAGQQGWLQNTEGMLKALSGAGMKTASGGAFSL